MVLKIGKDRLVELSYSHKQDFHQIFTVTLLICRGERERERSSFQIISIPYISWFILNFTNSKIYGLLRCLKF